MELSARYASMKIPFGWPVWNPLSVMKIALDLNVACGVFGILVSICQGTVSDRNTMCQTLKTLNSGKDLKERAERKLVEIQ